MCHACNAHLHAAGRASSSIATASSSVSCGSATWHLCIPTEHAAGHNCGRQLPLVRLRSDMWNVSSMEGCAAKMTSRQRVACLICRHATKIPFRACCGFLEHPLDSLHAAGLPSSSRQQAASPTLGPSGWALPCGLVACIIPQVHPCCRDTKQRRAARANNMAKLISSDISFPVPAAPKREAPAPKPEPVLAAAPSAAAAAAAPVAAKDEEEQVHDLIMHEIW